jgi:SnoaL-like domain
MKETLMTGSHTLSDLKALAARYIETVGRKEFDALAPMLHPELDGSGNIAPTRGADAWIAALRNLSPVLVRNEIRKVFAEGNEACILYDFVTTVCPVPCAEWLTFEGDRIRSIYFLFDRSRWPDVMQELQRR